MQKYSASAFESKYRRIGHLPADWS